MTESSVVLKLENGEMYEAIIDEKIKEYPPELCVMSAILYHYEKNRVIEFSGKAKCKLQVFEFSVGEGQVKIKHIGPSKDAWKRLNEERGCSM